MNNEMNNNQAGNFNYQQPIKPKSNLLPMLLPLISLIIAISCVIGLVIIKSSYDNEINDLNSEITFLENEMDKEIEDAWDYMVNNHLELEDYKEKNNELWESNIETLKANQRMWEIQQDINNLFVRK